MVYKVAVIGAGAISQRHMEAIVAMEKLDHAGIADIQEERAKETAAAYGTRAYTDYREMVLKEQPDIVVITLPHFLHKEAAIWCAEQGCHLMLEKPMALNVEECDAISQAARSHGVKLMVGHTQHYIADNLKARDILRSGQLGELVMIRDVRHVNYYNEKRPDWFFHKAKAGGGIFMNLGSHSIDKIQWLTGSRVTKVKASVSYHGDRGDIEGSGIAYIETASGIPATICQSGYDGVNINETELIFTRGMLRLATGMGLWISEQRNYRAVELDKQEPPFVLQFGDLLRSIETGEELECSGAYGRSVIAAVCAMYESNQQGCEIEIKE